MEATSQHEREVRAARNQSLFRSINEKLDSMNEPFAGVIHSFTIACECAAITCVEKIQIVPEEYRAIRAEPRRFAVRPGHVLRNVEKIVRESERYAVVEKTGTAGRTAEAMAEGAPNPLDTRSRESGGPRSRSERFRSDHA